MTEDLISREEAVKRLTKRYEEQQKLFSPFSFLQPLETYIKRNIRAVQMHDRLKEYSDHD